MKLKLVFLLIILFADLSLFAAPSTNRPPTPVKAVVPEAEQKIVTINTVLFSEGNQSWTARDFTLYKKLVRQLTRQDKLTLLSDSLEYDFLISRLLKREALLFEIKPKSFEIPVGPHPELNEFSKAELNEETEIIELSSALLDLKEKQMSQKARFKAWVDVLKRKYNVKIKSNEFVI